MTNFATLDQMAAIFGVCVIAASSIIRWRKSKTTANLLMMTGGILLLSRTLEFAITTLFNPHDYTMWDFALLWILPPLSGLCFCVGYAIDSWLTPTSR
jgi:hypothetical protein